jgi:hypothetical protein
MEVSLKVTGCADGGAGANNLLLGVSKRVDEADELVTPECLYVEVVYAEQHSGKNGNGGHRQDCFT